MNEVTPKEVAAAIPSAGNEGNGTADNVSQPKTISTFVKAGSISLEKAALRIDYESFGKSHTVYISALGIRTITGPGNMPCDVETIREGIDGALVIEKIGRAWRSRSGRALVINTNQSQGELMTPWGQFKRVLDRQVQKAVISRFNPPPKPQPHPVVETGNNISQGLARGF